MLPSAVGVFYLLYVDMEALEVLLIRACLPCALWQDTYLISSVFPDKIGFKNYILTVCIVAHVL